MLYLRVMSAANVEGEVFLKEPWKTAGGETSRVGFPLLLVMVSCRVSLKVMSSYTIYAIFTSDITGRAAE